MGLARMQRIWVWRGCGEYGFGEDTANMGLARMRRIWVWRGCSEYGFFDGVVNISFLTMDLLLVL